MAARADGFGGGIVPDCGLLPGGGWITIVGRESSTRTLTTVVGVRTGDGDATGWARGASDAGSMRKMIDTGVGAAEATVADAGDSVAVARPLPNHCAPK